MARVSDVFASGTMANLVLYRRMGKSCMRIKRQHINQSAPTKIRGINFGIAARAGKALRHGLHEVIPFPTDRSMQSRFSGSIAKWLGVSNIDDLAPCDVATFISTFHFTPGANFNERFRVPFTVSHPSDNHITVSIDAFVPALHIVAPAGTVSVDFTLAVAGCILKNGTTTGNETHSITIPFNDIEIPAQVLEFNIPIPIGSLIVTAARLEYNVVKNNVLTQTANMAFMPADVIDARYC